MVGIAQGAVLDEILVAEKPVTEVVMGPAEMAYAKLETTLNIPNGLKTELMGIGYDMLQEMHDNTDLAIYIENQLWGCIENITPDFMYVPKGYRPFDGVLREVMDNYKTNMEEN